ncbi:MAG TPA: hypothetical protein VIU93_13325 [Gallionellaceae bacterium]
MDVTAHKRFLVLGCGGSGKSTYSRRLAAATGLDLVHLDSCYWKPGWNHTPAAEWEETVQNLIMQESWIIDGSYYGTLDMRLQQADAVIFFDLPRLVCIWRVIKRRLQNIGGSNRLGMPAGCPERIYWKFLKWVWRYRESNRPQVMDKLRQFSERGKVYVITSDHQAEKLLHELKR